MDLPDARLTRIISFLREEVPWEFERLQSLYQLVSFPSDWAAACSDPPKSSYSSWLRQTHGGLFASPP